MILLLLFFIVVLLAVISWIGMVKDIRRMNVKGPFPLPIVGNAHLFIAKPTELMDLLKKYSLKYGDAFRFHLFSNPFVVLSHAKYIEPLLTNIKYNTKGESINFFVPWLGQGLVTASGQHWKSHRKILTPAFHFNILQTFLPIFCKNQSVFTEKLRGLADGRSVDVYPLVAVNILSNVSESMMGVSLGEEENRVSEYFKSLEDLLKIVSLRLTIPFLRHDAVFNLLPYKTTHDRAITYLHDYTRAVIVARREELKKLNITSFGQTNDLGTRNKYAFLDLLLFSEIDGKPIDDESVKEEVETFMFAGHDTTATTICNTLYCLAKHRHVQEKVFKEQKQIFGDDIHRDPTYTELQQMKYLEMVIKESMRLYPAIALTERKITEDCEVGGVKLLKGTLVWINIIQSQCHPDLFDDPLEFRPERFEKPLKHPLSWLAFSVGPRNCIGQKFAMMNLKVNLAAIIKNFIILPTEMDPKFSLENVTYKAVNGVHVRFLCSK